MINLCKNKVITEIIQLGMKSIPHNITTSKAGLEVLEKERRDNQTEVLQCWKFSAQQHCFGIENGCSPYCLN